MIYLKRHRFLYIEVPKAGSTSLSHFFINNACNDDDVYSGDWSSGADQTCHNIELIHCKVGHKDLNYIIDHNILSEQEVRASRVVGIIREPFERLLSCFFAKIKQRELRVLPTKEEFKRNLIEGDGRIIARREWLRKQQADFMQINGENIGEWILFERLDNFIKDVIIDYDIKVTNPFEHRNKGLSVDYRKLIDTWYDNELLDLVHKNNQDDFEIYERTKNEYRETRLES